MHASIHNADESPLAYVCQVDRIVERVRHARVRRTPEESRHPPPFVTAEATTMSNDHGNNGTTKT